MADVSPDDAFYRWMPVDPSPEGEPAPAKTIERITAQFDGQFELMHEAMVRKTYHAALILMYAAIDALAWLDRRSDGPDVTRQDFVEWVSRYMLPRDAAGREVLAPIDLYAARCAVHPLVTHTRRVGGL